MVAKRSFCAPKGATATAVSSCGGPMPISISSRAARFTDTRRASGSLREARPLPFRLRRDACRTPTVPVPVPVPVRSTESPSASWPAACALTPPPSACTLPVVRDCACALALSAGSRVGLADAAARLPPPPPPVPLPQCVPLGAHPCGVPQLFVEPATGARDMSTTSARSTQSRRRQQTRRQVHVGTERGTCASIERGNQGESPTEPINYRFTRGRNVLQEREMEHLLIKKSPENAMGHDDEVGFTVQSQEKSSV